jgi:hypothetical protein
MSRVSRLSTIIDDVLIYITRGIKMIVAFVVYVMLGVEVSDGVVVIEEWIKRLTGSIDMELAEFG